VAKSTYTDRERKRALRYRDCARKCRARATKTTKRKDRPGLIQQRAHRVGLCLDPMRRPPRPPRAAPIADRQRASHAVVQAAFALMVPVKPSPPVHPAAIGLGRWSWSLPVDRQAAAPPPRGHSTAQSKSSRRIERYTRRWRNCYYRRRRFEEQDIAALRVRICSLTFRKIAVLWGIIERHGHRRSFLTSSAKDNSFPGNKQTATFLSSEAAKPRALQLNAGGQLVVDLSVPGPRVLRLYRTSQESGEVTLLSISQQLKRSLCTPDLFGFCLTMHERASSRLERPEGFFCRNGRKYFDVVEWIFRFGR
jgi:hypothetical protein